MNGDRNLNRYFLLSKIFLLALLWVTKNANQNYALSDLIKVLKTAFAKYLFFKINLPMLPNSSVL